MFKIRFVFIFVIFVLGLETTVFSADYFLYDKEKNNILFMGQNDNQFTEKISMEKNPDMMMPTCVPDKYLAIYAPETANKKEEPQKGQLITFNINTGRTEDLVELGYAPFKWIYTKNRQHLFISYRPDPKSETLSLLHYDISQNKSEIITDFAKEIKEFVLSYDENKLFTLIPGDTKKKQPGKILSISYLPLSISATINTDINPAGFYVLDSEKIALIDGDDYNQKQKGALRIIKNSDYSTIEEYKFDKPSSISLYWENDYHVLICATKQKNKSVIYKVTPKEVNSKEIPSDWFEIKYNKEKDQLYILTRNEFRMLNYTNNNLSSCKTGKNIYDDQLYNINYISETDLVVLYCFAGGDVKFIDLKTSKLIDKVSYGRKSTKAGNFLVNLTGSIVISRFLKNFDIYSYNYFNFFKKGVNIASNTTKTKYFVLGTATRDITVYDKDLKTPTYIVPPEKPLMMYQTNKTDSKILVLTKNNIYQIENDLTLKPIFELKEEFNLCFFHEEKNHFIILTDRELLVLNPETLEIKNSFRLYMNPQEKYTRLKEGEQRYFFIPAL